MPEFRKRLVRISLIILFFLGIVGYIFFYTRQGVYFVTQQAMDKYLEGENLQIEEVGGTIKERVYYKNIEMTDLKGFPKGTILRIQNLSFAVTSLSIDGIFIEVQNARLKLPYSDPIVLNGQLKDGNLKFNTYSTSLDVREILGLIPDQEDVKYFSGTFKDADLYIEGTIDEPRIFGKFFVEDLKRQDFFLNDSPGTLDLKFRDYREAVKLSGFVALEGGTLRSMRSPTIVNLEPSRFLFEGRPRKVAFDIHGNTKIENIFINIVLRGNKDEPDFTLTSDPPFSKSHLLLMLATGKSWKSDSETFDDVSSDLAKGVLSYLFFSGESKGLGEKIDISDFTLKYDEQTKGVGGMIDVFDRAGIGYGIEQSDDVDKGESTITQKLEGEYRLTPGVSIDVERRFIEERLTNQETPESLQLETDDRIQLKYKTKF